MKLVIRGLVDPVGYDPLKLRTLKDLVSKMGHRAKGFMRIYKINDQLSKGDYYGGKNLKELGAFFAGPIKNVIKNKRKNPDYYKNPAISAKEKNELE